MTRRASRSTTRPDADFVTVRGEVMKGTGEIEAGLSRIFRTRAGNATLREIDASIRLLGPDVALVHVTNELSGLVGHNTRLGESPQ